MSFLLLDKINSPSDLKNLNHDEIPRLCEEIRAFLIENVERQGGHLASNLGVTELTVAMHRVFNSPSDHFIFDVGHQSYVHKILTGRRDRFCDLRKPGGLSGFTSMKESEHDAFGAGHSSTSVSAGIGYAEADLRHNKENYTVVLLGDGAYTGGMVHEALNNVNPKSRLIIILNENGMSISVNKGHFASYLSSVRISKGYRRWKRGTKSILDKIPLGFLLSNFLAFIKGKFKSLFFSSNYFEDLGLYYIGPVDANNYEKAEKALKRARELDGCVVVHVKTQKGKGYLPAENSPDGYHSLNTAGTDTESFHSVFADKLISLAENDKKIVAVTAAMGLGTGLDKFGKKYPERYFDVGIAEGHALTFSAGLAAAGEKPFVAVYSTFLQRAYDSIIHDIAIQGLPVKIMIDRAGLATSDGATHHGIFDVAFLLHIPNIEILSPITFDTLRCAIDRANNSEKPIAVRYPNASENKRVLDIFYAGGGDSELGIKKSFENAPDYLFITYGRIIDKVILADDILKGKNQNSGIMLLEKLKPFDEIALEIAKFAPLAKKVLFVEEGIKNGGAGMVIRNALSEMGVFVDNFEILAIDESFATFDTPCDIYEMLGMSPEGLAERITK